jgi:hypothetical protein
MPTSAQRNLTNEIPMGAIIAPFNKPTFLHTNDMIPSPSFTKIFQDFLFKSWGLVYIFDTPSPSNPMIIKQSIPNGFLHLTTIPFHIIKNQIVTHSFNRHIPHNESTLVF